MRVGKKGKILWQAGVNVLHKIIIGLSNSGILLNPFDCASPRELGPTAGP
jgi:hypothetical protein